MFRSFTFCFIYIDDHWEKSGIIIQSVLGDVKIKKINKFSEKTFNNIIYQFRAAILSAI